MFDKKQVRIQIGLLLGLAAILRVVYFVLTYSHLGDGGLWTVFYDTDKYRLAASQVLSEYTAAAGTEDYLFLVGPGYPVMVAALRILFGSGAVYVCMLSNIAGVLAPILVYLIALNLRLPKTVAFIAGIIGAISTTSLALSSAILSNQPFFALMAASLLCLIIGLNGRKYIWFIVSGLIAGMAVYFRGTAQFWWLALIFIALAIPIKDRFKSRLDLLKKACISSGIILIFILAWSARNYFVHDVFVFSGNAVQSARIYLAAKAVADHTENAGVLDIRQEWSDEDDEFFGPEKPTAGQQYARAAEQFTLVFRNHPGWIVMAYFAIVKGNILAGNHLPLSQIPALNGLWRRLILINGKWLAHLIFYLTLLGLLFLIIDRHYLSSVILGTFYAYFTLVTGFSFWQGSRLYFTTEIASSIFVAYAVYRIWRFSGIIIIRLRRRLGQSL